MITVPGTLYIRSIQGKNGVFSVGRLVTGVGSFAVKDAQLDQYGPGRYAGLFHITRVYPAAYPCQGQMVVELRAKLAGMDLDAVDTVHSPPPQDIAVDPLEPALSPPAEDEEHQVQAAQDATPQPELRGQDAPLNENPDDALLFGPLWPLGRTVRLDSTVERPRLRQQIARLKALGYRFDAKTQTWSMAEDWLLPG